MWGVHDYIKPGWSRQHQSIDLDLIKCLCELKCDKSCRFWLPSSVMGLLVEPRCRTVTGPRAFSVDTPG